MGNYNPRKIESRWQKEWAKQNLYQTKMKKEKKKFYVLDMFPYPSGEGLHVGHIKGYIATDITARYKMMRGFNVLHPMGWDAFGLPAENYAMIHQIHPRNAVEKNIKKFKTQMEKIGFAYDWTREINTTDPQYYKWTQWIFLQMFKRGLAYQSFEPINWCPRCQTGLANEDLEAGRCERCSTQIERRPMRQWVLKMTVFADRLLKDLKLVDWDEAIIEQQKNWIGRSEGAEFEMAVKAGGRAVGKISVFTTRLDTSFGITYAVVAPEHEIITQLKSQISNLSAVEKYIKEAGRKTDLERTELTKEKTGLEIKGLKAVNPFNQEEVPLFIADYVLAHYGTGAVMAVPAHDERDYDLAKKYGLKIKEVIQNVGQSSSIKEAAFIGDGILINSGEFNGLSSKEAREKMINWLEKNKLGQRKVNYKMRDWVFSRQRYWGEPIPIIHCPDCGTMPVPEKDLPVVLPQVKNYQPTGTGESPLADIKHWTRVRCSQCGGKGRRETNTMPQWAGSCWYYLRYLDPKNKKALVDKEKERYWMNVDLYVGGAEHATRHLLYARFWHKFLYDLGVVSTLEPFQKLINVGLISGADGRKMSKRWDNVVNPDEVVKNFSADALRLYEMFIGPFTQGANWHTRGVVGMKRFLDKILNIKIQNSKLQIKAQKDFKKLLHQTIKKVTEDIEAFRFNTAISTLMILVHKIEKQGGLDEETKKILLQLLAPFAPHLAEDLWRALGQKQSIFKSIWPEYDRFFIKADIVSMIIQINGQVRDQIETAIDINEDELKEIVLKREKIKKWLERKEIKKIIFVPGKLINLVI